MIKITDIKSQNKKALRMVLAYYDLYRTYEEAMRNMSYIAAANNDGMPHGTSVGNPVQNKAMRLIDIEDKKKWIMVLDAMDSTLSEKKRAFLRFRRDAENQIEHAEKLPQGRPSWVPYVQAHYAVWFADRYGREVNPPCARVMTRWMNDIVDVTVRIAIHEGMFE